MTHTQRIERLLCRLSRSRIIESQEAYDIAWRGAQKWSFGPGSTIKAFEFLLDKRLDVRYWRGERCFSLMPDYDRLEKEAAEQCIPYMSFYYRKCSQEAKLFVRLHKVDETRRFINRVKKELSNVNKD